VTPTPVFARDAERLANIHAAAFDTPWSPAEIADVLGGPGAFGLGVGDRGFVLCRVIVDEAEILTLAVRPADRRRGVAAALAIHAMAVARASGAASMFLEAADDNPGALALYAALDFAEVGRRDGYYVRPTGAVAARIMRRDLNR